MTTLLKLEPLVTMPKKIYSLKMTHGLNNLFKCLNHLITTNLKFTITWFLNPLHLLSLPEKLILNKDYGIDSKMKKIDTTKMFITTDPLELLLKL